MVFDLKGGMIVSVGYIHNSEMLAFEVLVSAAASDCSRTSFTTECGVDANETKITVD